MPAYQAPLRDIQFVLWELLNADKHYQSLHYEDASPDMVDAILAEAARFAEDVLSPLNAIGDQGCQFHDGEVTTPPGFKEAYQQWVDSGWPSLAATAEMGGQGLPESIAHLISEMVGSANWAWAMYPGLSHGAINTLEQHGTEAQKSLYLSKLVSGQWTGTMCLTEPHCGSDLGQLRTKALPQSDGSYRLQGNKIYISAGEHDMAENIIHIVLARLPDAPAGTKGISLFVVPKFLANGDGSLGARNELSCGSIEHKMGIHGNATAVLNFDGAQGWLIGPVNQGLQCMFTFMNFARIGTAIQGVAATELAFQGALTYSQERLAMRSLSGTKAPEKAADPIIVHPDVRRMLLTQKAVAEGGRALLAMASQQVDIVRQSQDPNARAQADAMLGFITPIAKAFLTELALETTNYGVQIFGGHGYVQDYGMEQIVRDARISTIYEGTTAIQALDLLGRKVLGSNGALLRHIIADLELQLAPLQGNFALAEFVQPLQERLQEWQKITDQVSLRAMVSADEVGGAAYDYLMYSGYVLLSGLWLRMAALSHQTLARGTDEPDFYEAKIKTARFWFERILPRCNTHAAIVASSVDVLLDLSPEQFRF